MSPHSRLGISLPDKTWNHPRKIRTRDDTIIDTIHQVFGNKIPENRQYWTLCGRSIGSGTEFDQLIKSGLIKPEQFNGVEINPDIHLENMSLPQGHFWQGDFYEVMLNHKHTREFNPAAVNFDSVNMPTEAANQFAKIFRLLSRVEETPILFIANVVLSCYSHRSSIDDFITRLGKKIPWWAYQKWIPFNEQYYEYNGTGDHSGTKMGTIVMLRS